MAGDLKRLTDALFAQMDRLASVENPEELDKEVERSKAVASLAQNITANNKLALDVAKTAAEMECGETIGKCAHAMLGSGE